MSDQLRTEQGSIEQDTVVPGDGNMLNGAGAGTNEYNDTDGDANGTTYLKTNLGGVDAADVSIHTNDGALSTSSVGVIVADARPAEPSDFASAADYVDGTILFTLVDEDGSGEIANDTALDGNNLEFTYTATRQ